jgi:hypothetical protein
MHGRFMKFLVATTWLPEFNVLVFAVLLNFPWELLQVPMFEKMADAPHWEAVKTCAFATLGDAVITLAAYECVAVVAGTRRWIVEPGKAAIAGFVSIGLSITVVLERLVLEGLWITHWSYSPSMPLVPGLKVGLTPVLQWLLLPPLLVWFVRRQLGVVHTLRR